MSRSGSVVLGLAVVLGLTACVAVSVVLVVTGPDRAAVWATVIGAPVGVVIAVAAVLALVPRRTLALPPELRLEDWVIDRPAELGQVTAALTHGRRVGGMVAITTALTGAGGFGKTTVAKMACADQRIRRHFGGRVHLVTIGRDVRGPAAIAAKVNDLIKLVGGEDATFTDPEQAGQRLGSLLDEGSRRLLVLDDVWEREQLDPFTSGGTRCARLVTTRKPELLAGRGTAVRVDQMSPAQARRLLTFGLPPLDPAVADELFDRTGRWPLLLRLVNKILANAAQTAADGAAVSAAGAQLLERLRAEGPVAADRLLGVPVARLDAGNPRERERAVQATVDASRQLLDPADAERFAELAVFAEDEVIPPGLVATLWGATAGMDQLRATQVCARLADLALVTAHPSSGENTQAGAGSLAGAAGVALHDVVRDMLRAELGPVRLAELHQVLVDAVAAGLPAASPVRSPGAGQHVVAWWELDTASRYLWDHLIEHLNLAGKADAAAAVASDLRWVGARLERFGPVAAAADLAQVGTPDALRLKAVLNRVAHLLAPAEPTGAVEDILHSRVADDPDWGPQVTALRGQCQRSRLIIRWLLPDLADPALQRVLTGHADPVRAAAINPDGTWLATAGDDGTVRTWHADGNPRVVLRGHAGPVNAVAISPDGTWLATASHDGTIRTWHADGALRTVLRGHSRPVNAVAISPDGTWLATASHDGTARTWHADGNPRVVLRGHAGPVNAVAISPDGTWLATASHDGTARTWHADGNPRVVLRGHAGPVNAVAISPDGTWLATASHDRSVRTWHADGALRAFLVGHTDWVHAVAISPDGTWLATASSDWTLRTWYANGNPRTTLRGHAGPVHAVAISPDGTWLATASNDRSVRTWHADGALRTVLPGHADPVHAVAISPDGTWLAIASNDELARTWYVDGTLRAVLRGHTGWVRAVAISPVGAWLATASNDGTARTWHANGALRTTLRGHTGPVNAVAITPSGTWLVTASDDGTVRSWHANGKPYATLKGHTGPVNGVAISPDGTWLATVSDDRTVRTWHGTSRAVLRGHTGPVNAVAISPVGAWLATASDDGTVRTWHADGTPRAILRGHTGPVNAVAISPGGTRLATASSDRTLRIWDAATGQITATMRVENNLLACAWIDSAGLAAGGPAGAYAFNFLTGTARKIPAVRS